ncbi:MAG: chorismate synthase [Kiritimatiellae bacterium]|nr:chorismate synthase [Kiritimatiellia bacterium]
MQLGRQLKLEVYGESHAPKIGMRLTGFPRGERVDVDKLQAFMERRAPGRDSNSTQRREPDEVEFVSGLDAKGVTTGGTIEAIIRNRDCRSGDYEKSVPRPGHADYPNWVKTGAIPPGGGANSGRMTAPMCIAGALALQSLERKGVKIAAKAVFCPDIEEAKREGDSVGGIIECEIDGLKPGLGGAMFDGFDGAIAEAIFGIPGVKGIEFGNGFAAARLRGSENNDPFAIENGKVVTLGNNHGGILGGMTSGMKVVFRVAMKPTPSIYKEQKSVDLSTMTPVALTVRGRHDPCIALRAVPVVEALAAFTALDFILEDETSVEYGENLMEEIASLGKCVIDSNVARLYPRLAENAIFTVPSGEATKTIDTVSAMWSAFAKAGLGRNDCIVAIGGGVTGDMTGFAAATFMRGIDWINVPTTLLSMVDASFGGKTACDLPEGKNLAGAFHSPRSVIIDTAFLRTLPARELACGRAEMIKHEIISGRVSPASGAGIPSLDELKKSLAVKIATVKRDPCERTGERMKLNAGHTVAHALEKATGFALTHGEAVAIGCVEEARLAERLSLAKPGWADEVKARFQAAALPTELPDGISFESLKPLMAGDKKRDGASVVFALPCGWGDVRAWRMDLSPKTLPETGHNKGEQ